MLDRNPNEPVYCQCKRISFGEMVACENPDCAVEWFHFMCVGLASAPEVWYCADCASTRSAEGDGANS